MRNAPSGKPIEPDTDGPFCISIDPGRVAAGLTLVATILLSAHAVGIEILAEPLKSDSLAYNLSTLVEEGMEMFGVIVFLRTLLFHLRDQSASVFSFRLV